MADKGISLDGAGEKGPYQVDKGTKDMSIMHRKDTLEYNLRHAEEHLGKAREACEQLEKAGHDEPPPVSKQMLSHMDYFEEAVGHHEDLKNKVKRADKKLKNHITRNY